MSLWVVSCSQLPVVLTCNVKDSFEQAFAAVRQVSDLGVRVESELRWALCW